MKVIFSHPTGNANVRAAAKGFAEAEILYAFYTSIAIFSGSIFDRIGAIEKFSEIRRRRFDSALKQFTRTKPWREFGRIAAQKAGWTYFTEHENGPFCIDAVYQSIDRRVASELKYSSHQKVSSVYAYEDGAESTFKKAKKIGLQCFYDLPTGYWRAARRLLKHERERWPEWESTMIGFSDSTSKLARKDEELRLADRIFTASKFTASTLEEYPGQLAPIDIIPYGFPPVNNNRKYSSNFNTRPLKLLYVGKLSQQKGIADLFAAIKEIKGNIELTVVGSKVSDNCPALDTALRKHYWFPTLSHEKVLKLMQQNDVLVFPSLFDGFGLVITEAMAQGTPVIATDRCAGPDLINHGQNGWLVKAASTLALQSQIEELLNSPNIIAQAGKEAMETARIRPWEVYMKELSNAMMRYSNI